MTVGRIHICDAGVTIDDQLVRPWHKASYDKSARAFMARVLNDLASGDIADGKVDSREQEVVFDVNNHSSVVILRDSESLPHDFDIEFGLF